MNPPPIPGAPENRKSSARQAASLSLLAPIIAILLAAAVRGAKQGEHLEQHAAMMLGAAVVLLILIGIVCAVIGLAGTQREGSRGILWRSIIGLVINGLILALFAIGFISGFARARQADLKANREIRQAEEDFNAGIKKSFNSKTGITNFDETKFKEFQGRLTNALQNLSGDDAKVGQAVSVFMNRLNTSMKSYQAAVDKLREAHVLGTVTNKSALAERREIVNQFITANNELTLLITNGESIMREDLQNVNIPSGLMEETLAGYRKGANTTVPITSQIRACDNKLGHATLDTINLLESEWGNWRYDQQTGRIRFQSSTARQAYNSDLAIINSNATAEVQLQKQLIQRQQKASSDATSGQSFP